MQDKLTLSISKSRMRVSLGETAGAISAIEVMHNGEKITFTAEEIWEALTPRKWEDHYDY